MMLGATSAAPFLSGQNIRRIEASHMRAVMPQADRFSDASGAPPVVTGYAVTEDGYEVLVGYVFLTSDYPPEQIGYSGPIEALVGMRPDGTITGVRVIYYDESYMRQMGDFLRRPGFQQQFSGKYIGDPFRVWGDVDGISRVTISVRALSRGIRDSARQVAASYAEGATNPAAVEDNADITVQSWFELNNAGVVERMDVTDPGEGSAGISFAYIGSDALGEYLLGRPLYERAVRQLRTRPEVEHLVLYAVEGPRLRLFVREGWSIEQGGDTTAIEPVDVFSLALLPTEGLVSEEASMVGVFLIDRDLDLREPFRFIYDLGARLGVHTVEYATADVRSTAAAVAASGAGATEAVDPTAATDDTEVQEASVNPTIREGSAALAGADSVDPGAEAAPLSPAGSGLSPATAPEESPAPDPTPPDSSSPASGEPSESEPVGGAGALDAADSPSPAISEEEMPEARPPGPVGDALQDFDFTVTSEETLLERTLAETSWSRVLKMLVVLLLALWAFFAKTAGTRWVSLGATIGVLGFLDGSFLSVSHITSGIWAGSGVYLRDLPLLIMVVFTVVTTLLWGRVFCGFTCPFGALQDVLERLVPGRLQRTLPRWVHDRALYVKYGVLGLIVIPALLGSHVSLYQYFEPFGTVFFRSPSLFFWGIAGVFLLASVIVPRFYCRYACPLGAALAIGSLVSLKRIGRVEHCDHCKVCEQACPTGAIRGPEIDFKECVRCNACEVLLGEKRGVCRHDMDEIRPRLVQLQERGVEVSHG